MSDTQPRARILLIEDDTKLASAYTERMIDAGYEVSLCQAGEDALTDAMNYRPDLIVLDIMMHRISGFDLLDILRSTPATKHIKIILLTAMSQPADRARATRLGADEYMVKSHAVINDVMAKIRYHLGQPE